MLLSFGTNVLDFLWHGLNYPDSLPARQSFLYIFLILVMCYDAFRNVEGTSPRQIIYGYLAAVIFYLPVRNSWRARISTRVLKC